MAVYKYINIVYRFMRYLKPRLYTKFTASSYFCTQIIDYKVQAMIQLNIQKASQPVPLRVQLAGFVAFHYIIDMFINYVIG